MIEVDKKVLDQFLADGKITKEQYDQFIIKEITIGNDVNDIEMAKDLYFGACNMGLPKNNYIERRLNEV